MTTKEMNLEFDELYGVTLTYPGMCPHSMNVIDELVEGIGERVSCTYDAGGDETVFRIFMPSEDKARELFASIRREIKDGEIKAGTVQMYRRSQLSRFGH